MPAVLSKLFGASDEGFIAYISMLDLNKKLLSKIEDMLELGFDEKDNFPDEQHYITFCDNLSYLHKNIKKTIYKHEWMLDYAMTNPNEGGKRDEIFLETAEQQTRIVNQVQDKLATSDIHYQQLEKLSTKLRGTSDWIYGERHYLLDDYGLVYHVSGQLCDAELSDKVTQRGTPTILMCTGPIREGHHVTFACPKTKRLYRNKEYGKVTLLASEKSHKQLFGSQENWDNFWHRLDGDLHPE